jgi:hypothetical protein
MMRFDALVYSIFGDSLVTALKSKGPTTSAHTSFLIILFGPIPTAAAEGGLLSR